jgi:hypothetical protein
MSAAKRLAPIDGDGKRAVRTRYRLFQRPEKQFRILSLDVAISDRRATACQPKDLGDARYDF